MNDTDYSAALGNTLTKLGAIRNEIERLEIEASKLRQFFAATLNMLPDDERAEWLKLFRDLTEMAKAKERSLKRAILHVLLDANYTYLTVTNVRDRLQATGFDFTNYKSNALASVSTTLRRFNAKEVESTLVEGVTVYRMAASYRRSLERETDKMESKLAGTAQIVPSGVIRKK